MAGKTHLLLLFSLFFLVFSIHAKLHLYHSDFKALLTLQKDLGVNGQLDRTSACNADGVFCERRLSGKENYRVTRLVFKSKKLNGVLSPAIGRLTELKELSLSNNNPPQIVDCRKLEILDLSGEVPSELSSLKRLRLLDISSNKLSGNLNFLKYFPNLEILSVANNFFTGRVPPSVRSFRNLRHFNISGNRFLESSALSPGPAPAPAPHTRHPKNNSGDAAAASGPSPNDSWPKHRHSRHKISMWVAGFISGAVAAILLGFVFRLLYILAFRLIKARGKKGGQDIYSPLIKKAEDLRVLGERRWTRESLEMIGAGGCGEVYKAKLPGTSGKMIAIKKVVQPPNERVELLLEDSKLLDTKMRQIRSEIKTVGEIRHRNLLPLLAHVSRPDCHYLVYEFMKNGSLQDMLSKVKRGEGKLDWLTRHKIALGVASGLDYIHMSHYQHIIHRDLKPANILLDDDMEARITDFGLAKVMPEYKSHVTTSHLAGTLGYIAPEYFQGLELTDKCDIYSFGIILGVLVIGKFSSDEFFQHTDEVGLAKWMKSIISSENPGEAIDPKLRGNGFEEQMLLVLKIACLCTLDNPNEKPSCMDVRCMLYQIKH